MADLSVSLVERADQDDGGVVSVTASTRYPEPDGVLVRWYFYLPIGEGLTREDGLAECTQTVKKQVQRWCDSKALTPQYQIHAKHNTPNGGMGASK